MDSVQVEKLFSTVFAIHICVCSIERMKSERDEVRACMSDMVIAIIFINIMPA